MIIYTKTGDSIEAHLSAQEVEAALAAQTISGVDVAITGEDSEGGYRTIRVSEIAVTRTLNELKRRDTIPIPEDPPPLQFEERDTLPGVAPSSNPP